MRRVIVVAALLVLAGCGGSDKPAGSSPTTSATTSSTPQQLSETEQVVQKMWKAFEQGDCDAVKRVVVTPSAIDCAQLGEVAGMFVAEGIDLDAARYEEGETAGDSATVKITWNDTLPTETIDLQRVDGTWLVVFDSAA